MEEEYICKECGNSIPLSAFYKNKSFKTGHVNTCKYCLSDRKPPNTVTKVIIDVRPYIVNLGAHKISELTGIGEEILKGIMSRKEAIPHRMQVIIRKALGL